MMDDGLYDRNSSMLALCQPNRLTETGRSHVFTVTSFFQSVLLAHSANHSWALGIGSAEDAIGFGSMMGIVLAGFPAALAKRSSCQILTMEESPSKAPLTNLLGRVD